MTVKAILLAKRADGIARPDFRHRYETEYVPLVRSACPDIVSYTRDHVVGAEGYFAGWEPNYDVAVHLTFADRDSLNAALTRLATGELSAVEAGLVASTTKPAVLVDNCVSVMPPSDAPVAHKTLLQAARLDTLTRPQFQDYYEHGHAVLARKLMAPHFLGYSRNHVLESLTPGWQPDFDVITEFSFDSNDLDVSPDELRYMIRDEETFFDRASLRFVTVEEED